MIYDNLELPVNDLSNRVRLLQQELVNTFNMMLHKSVWDIWDDHRNLLKDIPLPYQARVIFEKEEGMDGSTARVVEQVHLFDQQGQLIKNPMAGLINYNQTIRSHINSLISAELIDLPDNNLINLEETMFIRLGIVNG